MADHRPDTEGWTVMLRREVIVPASPPHQPHILVALSVLLVLLAGAVDAFLWKYSRERASPRPAVQIDLTRRLERLERRHRSTPTHPSQVIGPPPYEEHSPQPDRRATRRGVRPELAA